jgi:hypothetical protein
MVIFHSTFPEEGWNGAKEHAAMITGVASGDVVDLTIFPAGEMPVPLRRVHRKGSFVPIDGFPYRCWAWPERQ